MASSAHDLSQFRQPSFCYSHFTATHNTPNPVEDIILATVAQFRVLSQSRSKFHNKALSVSLQCPRSSEDQILSQAIQHVF